MDTGLLRQLESTKNELHLNIKIRNTLEHQLQEYKKQQTNSVSKDKFCAQELKLIELSEQVQNLVNQLREEAFTNDRISDKLDETEIENRKFNKLLESAKANLSEANFKLEEQEKQIKLLSKPSVEQMKRDTMAAKSKTREKDSQIADLKDRIIELERENEKQKETIKSLKKDSKTMKQDLGYEKSIKIVQSERDELEEKLRNEFQQRQTDAKSWHNEKTQLENTINSLRVHNIEITNAT